MAPPVPASVCEIYAWTDQGACSGSSGSAGETSHRRHCHRSHSAYHRPVQASHEGESTYPRESWMELITIRASDLWVEILPEEPIHRFSAGRSRSWSVLYAWLYLEMAVMPSECASSWVTADITVDCKQWGGFWPGKSQLFHPAAAQSRSILYLHVTFPSCSWEVFFNF